MEMLYYWTDSNIQALRDNLEAARRGVVDASVMVGRLVKAIAADSSWSGDHRKAFAAWMDLLQQFHVQMANRDIGWDAVSDLDDFLTNLAGYYNNSEVHATLASIT